MEKDIYAYTLDYITEKIDSRSKGDFDAEEKLYVFQDGKSHDTVLCNKDINRVNELTESNDILCTNYRTVLKTENGVTHQVTLKISSSVINPGYKKYDGKPFNYTLETKEQLKENNIENDFFIKYCYINDIKELSKRYNLEPNRVVYYNTAYPQYPKYYSDLFSKIRSIYNDDLEADDTAQSLKAETKIKELVQEIKKRYPNIESLYQDSSKAIMFYITKMLHGLGYETIVVYPSAGFLLNTLHKNSKDLNNGLVRVYEGLGFEKIYCKTEVGNFFVFDMAEADQYMDDKVKTSSDFTKPVMIGNLANMIQLNKIHSLAVKCISKLEPVRPFIDKAVSVLPSFITKSKLGKECSNIDKFIKYDNARKYTASDPNTYDRITSRDVKILTPALEELLLKQENVSQRKYLKYKAKYLQLKKLNNI